MKIYIIIPCFNEAPNLAEAISRAKDYGLVIVVDDGSTDNSFEIARNSGVIVLRHFLNRGQGASLETGNRYAYAHGADAVVHFDSDGQHRAEEIPRLVEPILTSGYDAILGSRFLDGKTKTPFLKKWLILKPAVWFQNLLLGVKLTDAHNGFRALSRRALERISIKQDGMAHASEIVEQIKEKGLKYQEVPVTIIYNEFGQGFLGGIRILRDILFGKLNK